MILSGTFLATATAAGPTYLSDCTGTTLPPTCGTPVARWDTSGGAIPFCTSQGGRPIRIGSGQFEKAVRDAIAVWNAAGAQIVVSYSGDCAGSGGDGLTGVRNEIRFDIAGTMLGTTDGARTQVQMSLSPGVNPTSRMIVEADIVIGQIAGTLDPACFGDLVVHEMGHALGLGHSADVTDVMYPVLRSDIGACSMKPSAQEYDVLRSLYGAASRPTVTAQSFAPVPAAPAKPGIGQERLALALFAGGTLDDLEVWAHASNAVGVSVPDARGILHTLVVGSPAWVNVDFRAAFPRGWSVATPMILSR
ncbi:MAG: matrixin family metalloprotease [Dehalococcoidia bacterium]|nr:MAG: matrixin family metalloprotease [Dehalococcoidia bacterium]